MKSKQQDSITFGRLDSFILGAALVAFLAYAISSIFYFIGLNADGAFFFFDSATRIATHRSEWWSDDEKHIRLFANMANQLPLKLGMDMGIRDLSALRWLFSAPLFLYNALILVWIFALSRKTQDYTIFVFALAVHVLFISPSDIFAQNPARLAMGVYWLVFGYLTIPIRLNLLDKAALVSLTIFLFRSHEGIILCGPLLLTASLINWRQEGHDKLFKVAVGFSGACAALFGLYWQSTHPVGTQTSNYLSTILNLTPRDFSRTMFGFIWLPSLLIGLFGIRYRTVRRTGVGFWIPLIVLVLFGALPFFVIKFVQPGKEFNLRVYITAGGAGAMIIACYFQLRGYFDRVQIRVILLILAMTTIGQSLWHTTSLVQWNRFVFATRYATENAAKPLIDKSDVHGSIVGPMPEVPFRFDWWSFGYFGLTFGTDLNVKTVIRPPELQDSFKQQLAVAGDALFNFSLWRARCSKVDTSCEVTN